MQDFKRIGGEILSSPLNENFRKLRNDISIANSNLVFSDKYGIMATVSDMEALIDDPTVELTEGQACYVVSSGELYRYSNLDNEWHKIADFGQTYRQGFLNSGAVLVSGPIEVLSDDRTLLMPKMLVYFKNKPGEDPYLKGMYLIAEQEWELNLSDYQADICYSIMLNYKSEYTAIPGIPKEDDPNNIFIGTFMKNNGILKQEFVYTIPDIAYTADRGSFLLNGGQCSGAELEAHNSNLCQKSGFYYDEGVNYPGKTYYSYNIAESLAAGVHRFSIDDTLYEFSLDSAIDLPGILNFYLDKPTKLYLKQLDLTTQIYNVRVVGMGNADLDFVAQDSITNYPKSLDDASNYNLLEIQAKEGITNTYYTTSSNPIADLTPIDSQTYTKGIVYDKYDNGSEYNVDPGEFTIQKHLVTPTGQNIIVYGTQQYIDLEDAITHLNDEIVINGDFLYAEVTRIIVQNPASGSFNPETHCHFYSLNRLSLSGSIKPVFDDEEFMLFDGTASSPWFLQFKLDELVPDVADTYHLLPMGYANQADPQFGLDWAYVADVVPSGEEVKKDKREAHAHTYSNNLSNNRGKGYIIPSMVNIDTLRDRAKAIEKEIWDLEQNDVARYEQSIRYRLYKLENDIYNDYGDVSEDILGRLVIAEGKIQKAETYKANKETLINGYALGSLLDDYPNVPYTIDIQTGDIAEGPGLVGSTNLWFTQARVSANTDVVNATTHINTISANDAASGHTVVNPHHLSTDDIYLLSGTQRVFVTPDEELRIRSAYLPDDTKAELAALDNAKIENIPLYSINDSTQTETLLGNIQTLKIHSFGANVSVNGTTGILECVGQADPQTVMYRSQYAPIADHTVGKSGYVDKALFADAIDTTGIAASQYYGSDEDYPTTDVGWHDLPVYVSTGDAESYTNIDAVLLQPEEKSVALKHLATSRVVYTAADEETEIGDNVYNLVKNHYHKVYNSGSQGPYIEDPQHPGTYIQDTSGIIYTYKVPYGGLGEHIYYLEHNNVNYSFSTANLGTIPVNTIMEYIPADGTVTVEISGTPHTLTINQVLPSAVDDDYFLEFIAQTDWSKINQWNFGNNLTVTVSDGIATINAFNASGDIPVHALVNLDDVDFVYNNVQPGQMLVINADGDGIDVSDAPSMSSYMLISDYVNSQQPTKVNAAVTADNATLATTASSANLLQNTYSVNDNSSGNTVLWTSSKISTTISNKIATEGVRTDYGTTVPTSHTFAFTPKKGDLYILVA